MTGKMNIAVVLCIVGLISVEGAENVMYAASPTADLEDGDYAFEPYSNADPGPDTLNVTSDNVIKATGPCSAVPGDGIKIKATGEQGTSILGANATGRPKALSVAYMVEGVFVGEEGGGRGEVKTWTAEYDAPRVRVTNVPDYVYADATGAIPVTFKILDIEGEITLSSVTVGIRVWGNKLEFCGENESRELISRTAIGGATDNGESVKGKTLSKRDYIFTAWAPQELIDEIEVQGDTTKSSLLYVKVKISRLGDDKKELTCCSPIGDVSWPEQGVPVVFGDHHVQVVEIGQNPNKSAPGNPGYACEKWSVLDSSKHQNLPKIDKDATITQDLIKHLDPEYGDSGPEEYQEWEPPEGKHHFTEFQPPEKNWPLKTVYSVFPHPSITKWEWVSPTIETCGWDAKFLRTEMSRNKKAVELNIEKNIPVLHGKYPHKAQCRVKAIGATIGGYCGFSYGLKDDIKVLSTKSEKKGEAALWLKYTEAKSSYIAAFPSGCIDTMVKVDDSNDPIKLSLTIGKIALSVAGSLATGGWATVCVVGTGLLEIAAELNNPKDNPGGSVCSNVIGVSVYIPSGGPQPEQLFNCDQDDHGNCWPLQKQNQSMEVGDTWHLYITISAACCGNAYETTLVQNNLVIAF